LDSVGTAGAGADDIKEGGATEDPAIAADAVGPPRAGASAAANRAVQILVFMPFKLGGGVSKKLGVPE
jgi:hypothetical protein